MRHARVGHAHKPPVVIAAPTCPRCESSTHRLTPSERRCDACRHIFMTHGVDLRMASAETLNRRLRAVRMGEV